MAYIERKDLRNELYSRMDFYHEQGYQSLSRECLELIKYIDKMPTADVEEIRHGEWIEWWDDNYLSYCHKCSECGGYPLTKEETMHDEVLSAYCPHCGAKMDGGKDENV